MNPTPGAGAARELPRRNAALASVLVLQAILAGVPLVRGGWFADDIFNAAVAQEAPRPSWRYVSADFFGHFLPLSRLILWFVSRQLLHHTLVVIIELVVLLACTALFVEVLLRLLPDQTWLVYGTALLLVTTPLTLQSVMWWASAVLVLPGTLFLLVAMLATLLWLERARWWLLVVVAVAVECSVCCWDTANLAIVWLPALVLATPAASFEQRWRRVVRCWPVWAAVAASLVVYQIGYQATGPHTQPTVPPLSLLARFFGVAWGQGFVPGLIGGPLRWRYDQFGYLGVADPYGWLVVLGELVLVALVVVTVRRNRTAWYGWLLVALSVFPVLLLVAVGRLALIGTQAGVQYRYLSMSSVPALLGVAVAVSPGLTVPVPQRLRARRLAAVSIMVAAALGVASSVSFARQWDRLPTDAYLTQVASDASKLNRAGVSPVNLVGYLLPQYVVADYLHTGTSRTSFILGVLHLHDVTYDGVSAHPYVLDPKGHIVPAHFVTNALLKPAGARCTPAGKLVSLRFLASAAVRESKGYVLRLHVTTQSAGNLNVRLLRNAVGVPLGWYNASNVDVPAGGGDLSISENGLPFDGADVTTQSPSGVCISSIGIATAAR